MVVHEAYSCQPRVSILGYSFIMLKNIIFLSRSNREIDHLKYISKTQLPWMLWPLGPSELVVLRLQQPKTPSPEIGPSTFPVCKEQKHGLSGSIPNQNLAWCVVFLFLAPMQCHKGIPCSEERWPQHTIWKTRSPNKMCLQSFPHFSLHIRNLLHILSTSKHSDTQLLSYLWLLAMARDVGSFLKTTPQSTQVTFFCHWLVPKRVLRRCLHDLRVFPLDGFSAHPTAGPSPSASEMTVQTDSESESPSPSIVMILWMLFWIWKRSSLEIQPRAHRTDTLSMKLKARMGIDRSADNNMGNNTERNKNRRWTVTLGAKMFDCFQLFPMNWPFSAPCV